MPQYEDWWHSRNSQCIINVLQNRYDDVACNLQESIFRNYRLRCYWVNISTKILLYVFIMIFSDVVRMNVWLNIDFTDATMPR